MSDPDLVECIGQAWARAAKLLREMVHSQEAASEATAALAAVGVSADLPPGRDRVVLSPADAYRFAEMLAIEAEGV